MENIKQWIDEFENLSEIERINKVKSLIDTPEGKIFLRKITDFKPEYNDLNSMLGKTILAINGLGEIPIEILKKIDIKGDYEKEIRSEALKWRYWEEEIPEPTGYFFEVYFKETELPSIFSLVDIDGEIKMFDGKNKVFVSNWDGKNKIGELTIDKWHYFIAIK